MSRRSTLVVALGILIGPVGLVAAHAQSPPLAGTIKRLFDRSTINATTPLPSGAPLSHAPHFIVGENLKLVTRELNVSLAAQLASFPLSSSSGGFSFSVNERGEVVPTSTTFGPAFAERALTIGRGKFNTGFSFQATAYDSFEGLDLGSGRLLFVREHNDCCPGGANNPTSVANFTPDFERDLLQSDLTANIDTRTTAFFGSYGVTNRLDVGFAVPIVHVDLEARVDSRILRLGSGASSTIHVFENGADTLSLSERGSATGLGDILVRGKYNFYRSAETALAGAVELRLPTGDENDLLGTGATQTRLLFVGSGEFGMVSPHVNVGYTFSNGETSPEAASFDLDAATYGLSAVPNFQPGQVDLSVPDEFNFTTGLNVGLTPRVTVGFDVIGRHMRDVARFELQDVTYENRGLGPLPTTSFVAEDEVSIERRNGNLNLILGVVGGKINIGRTFILNATLIFPMNESGLQPKPTPVIGFDYVF